MILPDHIRPPPPPFSAPQLSSKFSVSAATKNTIMEIASIILISLGVALAGASLLIAFTACPLFACGLILAVAVAAAAVFLIYNRSHDEEWMLHHKVLDNHTERKQYNGQLFSKSIGSIIEDLKCSSKKATTYKNHYETLIKDLSFAKTVQSSIEWKNPFSSYFLKKQICQRIHALPTIHGPGVILPGGCKGHAILYHIQRNEDGTFNFTIINSGAGLTLAPGKRNHMVDVIYKNIPEDVLSNQFFGQLLFKQERNMKSVNDFIHKNLYRNDNLISGRDHRMQKQGTCSMKCLLVLLNNELGQAEYRKFKVSMTEEAIHQFEKKARKPLWRSNEEFQQMGQEAHTVLNKRRERALL